MSPRKPDTVLLVLGVTFVLLPLVFVVAFPDRFESAQLYLRLVASLGGALIGAWLPGLFHFEGLGFRATGALTVLVLFWLFNPPQQVQRALAPQPPSLAQLGWSGPAEPLLPGKHYCVAKLLPADVGGPGVTLCMASKSEGSCTCEALLQLPNQLGGNTMIRSGIIAADP